MRVKFLLALNSFIGLMALAFSSGLQAQSCAVQSGSTVPQVVELYTSEGCNSCPPADRWLSSLKDQPDVLAAAFHVDYWDRLGWKDRFASPAYTARQVQSIATSGARFAYTPQIIVDGQDWRGSKLPEKPATGKDAATLSLSLQRQGGAEVLLNLKAMAGAPARIMLWWAALEDGHVSQIKAGENEGATLHHDDVVRDYGQIEINADSPRQLLIKTPRLGEDGRQRRLIAVATDAKTGRVLQALALGC